MPDAQETLSIWSLFVSSGILIKKIIIYTEFGRFLVLGKVGCPHPTLSFPLQNQNSMYGAAM